jgi:hypothetical protein
VCSHPRKSYKVLVLAVTAQRLGEVLNAEAYLCGEFGPRGHRRDRHPGTVQVPAGGKGDIDPPSLLALLERHVAAVPRPPGGNDDTRWPHHVILRPWHRRKITQERGQWRGRRPAASMRGRARARLGVVPVFLIQDGIFMARAVGLWWCVRHRQPRTPTYKGQAGHRPRRA